MTRMQDSKKLMSKRASTKQKMALLQYMELRKDFALDGYTDSQGFTSNEQEWDYLANHLNTFGFAKKTGLQWKRTWIDMKYGMKKRYIKLTKLKGRNQRNQRRINAMDDRVRAIISEQGQSEWLSDEDNVSVSFEIDKKGLFVDDELSDDCTSRLPKTPNPNPPEPGQDNNVQPEASTSTMSEKSEPPAPPATTTTENINEPLRISEPRTKPEHGDPFDTPISFGKANRKKGDLQKFEKAFLKIEKRRYRLKKKVSTKMCKIKKYYSLQMLKLKKQEVDLLKDIKTAIMNN